MVGYSCVMRRVGLVSKRINREAVWMGKTWVCAIADPSHGIARFIGCSECIAKKSHTGADFRSCAADRHEGKRRCFRVIRAIGSTAIGIRGAKLPVRYRSRFDARYPRTARSKVGDAGARRPPDRPHLRQERTYDRWGISIYSWSGRGALIPTK